MLCVRGCSPAVRRSETKCRNVVRLARNPEKPDRAKHGNAHNCRRYLNALNFLVEGLRRLHRQYASEPY